MSFLLPLLFLVLPGDRVPAGRWGGDGVVVQVGEQGARLEFSCAHGTIDEPLAVDARGRFDLRGTYVNERGGPVREDEAPPPRARYVGELDGDRLRLSITLVQPERPVGAFTLTHGRAVRLVKCQ